jgi:PKD repeat protein
MSNEHPIAYFTYSPSSPTDLDVIQFTDESLDRDGTIVSWSWNFGDAGTSTQQNPTHGYADDGIYIVILTVTDEDGASDSISNDIVVSNVPPTADFTYSPSSPTDLDAVQFTDTSTDPDGMIVSWIWNFGDGTNSTSKNPQHNYSTTDQYTVVLKVTDNNGAKKSISKIITISQSEPRNNQPTANFSFYPSTAMVNDTIQFTDTSIDTDGTITSYLWNFGDGTNSTSKNPRHRFTINGTYSITLEITDDDGATDLTSKAILVDKDLTDTNGGNGTPGFELVFVMGAIAVALFLWRKNRNI